MPRSKRRDVVEKEMLRIARAPDLAMAALEVAQARDPSPRNKAPRAEPPLVIMETPAAVAHQGSAHGRCVKFAEGVDPVLQRRPRQAALQRRGARAAANPVVFVDVVA